eukprot:TRINITY_DN22766_c0_g1_i1.p1 TRINITY_DN22766_c0_g1~~TRINITY_DN22766_c0_g1_i1.p1  ORF type:complete len:478 (+),score=41.59 TRINITY_DN22766_c0_g1_i1:56-1489(+)
MACADADSDGSSASSHVSSEAEVDDEGSGGESGERAASSKGSPQRREAYDFSITKWTCRPAVFACWVWMISFKVAALRVGAPYDHENLFDFLMAVSNLPMFLVEIWCYTMVAGAPVERAWFGFICMFFSQLVGLVKYGGVFSGGVWTICGFLLGAVFAGGHRRILSISFVVWVGIFQIATVVYLRLLFCQRHHIHAYGYIFLQVFLRVSEDIGRRVLICLWNRWRGTAPSAVFALLLTMTYVGVEVSQLASFLAAASSKRHNMLDILAVMASAIVSDFVSRSRILCVLKDALCKKEVHRLRYTEDLVLRSRWVGPYFLMPPVCLMVIVWMIVADEPYTFLVAVLAYAFAEVLSSCVIFAWQYYAHRQRFGRKSACETFALLFQPFGHAFPSCCGAAEGENDMSEVAARPDEEPLRPFFCFRSSDMAGMYMASLTIVYSYQALLGYLIPVDKFCTNTVHLQTFLGTPAPSKSLGIVAS